MTSPVSSHPPCQASAAQSHSHASPAAQKSKPPQDTVQLSPEAKAASQSASHERDSH